MSKRTKGVDPTDAAVLQARPHTDPDIAKLRTWLAEDNHRLALAMGIPLDNDGKPQPGKYTIDTPGRGGSNTNPHTPTNRRVARHKENLRIGMPK